MVHDGRLGPIYTCTQEDRSWHRGEFPLSNSSPACTNVIDQLGDGIAEMRTLMAARKALKSVGFELLHEEDLAARKIVHYLIETRC